jgi:hypothetical protein
MTVGLVERISVKRDQVSFPLRHIQSSPGLYSDPAFESSEAGRATLAPPGRRYCGPSQPTVGPPSLLPIARPRGRSDRESAQPESWACQCRTHVDFENLAGMAPAFSASLRLLLLPGGLLGLLPIASFDVEIRLLLQLPNQSLKTNSCLREKSESNPQVENSGRSHYQCHANQHAKFLPHHCTLCDCPRLHSLRRRHSGD